MMPGCEAFDTALLRARGNPSRVHIIPAALTRNGSPPAAMRLARSYFGGLGVEAVEVPLLKRGDTAKGGVLELLGEAEVAYLLGGDPGHLRDTMVESASWTVMSERARRGELAVAGSSAGAMVLCELLLLRSRNPSPTQRHAREALGVVPETVLIPHLNSVREGWLAAARREAPQMRVLGLDECTGVVFDGTWRAHGPGEVRVWEAGEEKSNSYRDGDILGLPAPVLV
jgi:cyanophycinase